MEPFFRLIIRDRDGKHGVADELGIADSAESSRLPVIFTCEPCQQEVIGNASYFAFCVAC
jgi:hypothetical protein